MRAIRKDGFEWEVKWHPESDCNFAANFAWQKSYDSDTKFAIADAPARQAGIIANWEFLPTWHINANLNWVSGRQRIFNDPRPDIDDYSKVDFTVRKTNLLPGLELSFSARNAFDEKAYEPSDGTIPGDYPLEGASFWLGLAFVSSSRH